MTNTLLFGAWTTYQSGKVGGIFVFKDEIGDGLNYVPIALLQGQDEDSYFFSAVRMAIDEQFIYSSVYEQDRVFFIAYPKESDWKDNNSSVLIPYSTDTMFVSIREMEVVGDQIFVTALAQDETENIFIFHKDSIGHEGYYPNRIILKEGVKSSNFGIDVDAYDSQLIIGNNRSADFNYSNGVAELYQTFSDTVLQKRIFAETFYDASDHYFGNNLHYTNDRLLIGAPNDSENGTQFGAVYTYGRRGGEWQKEGKIVSSRK